MTPEEILSEVRAMRTALMYAVNELDWEGLDVNDRQKDLKRADQFIDRLEKSQVKV